MTRILLALCGSLVLGAAQNSSDLFDKAPPEVDQALRARIQKFYQAHVDGKFRQADEMVAEDSKDAFFAMEKKRYHSFEIIKIKYSDHFDRATALVGCEGDFAFSGKVFRMKAPVTSLWKVENGQWYWYTPPPSDVMDTPFGKMKFGPDPNAPGSGAVPRVDPATILKGVKVDRSEIVLSTGERNSASAVISNGTPGPVSLSLDYQKAPGVTVELDRKELKSGETAQVLVRSEPAVRTGSSFAVKVNVSPTNQVIPIHVRFEGRAK